MAEKAAVFIDGGYLNKINTEKFKLDYQRLLSCLLGSSMELWRAYYYNCLPYRSSNPSEEKEIIKEVLSESILLLKRRL